MDPINLKLNWLLYFQDIAKTNNYTRTADNFFTSQSNISYAIRMLENQLGVPLFYKKGNDIRLSKYGEKLLPHINAAIEEIVKGCNAIEEMIHPLSGTVKIGYTYSFLTNFVSDLYSFLYDTLRENNADITIRSSFAHVNEDLTRVEDRVLSGECDMGFTNLVTRDECNHILLGRIELAVLMSENHPLAKTESVTLQQLREEPFIILEVDKPITNYYGRMFEYFGIKPNTIAPGYSWMSILLQVANGRCITLAPTGSYSDYGVVAVPLNHPMKYRDLYLITPKNRKISQAATYVKNLIIDYFKNVYRNP